MINPRKICFDLLLRLENEGAYSNIIIDNFMKRTDIDGRDKTFICALFYGVLERKITLDYLISLFSKIKVKKLDKKVLVLLRMGIYQIMYMEKIPDSAAVNETVKLCKTAGVFSAKGYVNGVLRSLLRERDNIKYPDKNYLSVKYSCHEDIVNLLIRSYGREVTEGYLKSLFDSPPLTARVNTLKINTDEFINRLKDNNIEAQLHKNIDGAVNIISGKNALFSSKLFKDGMFHIQDGASQLCCKVLCPKEGETVIDVCASPGGKTATIAQLMNNKGSVIACDIHENKLSLINDTAKRLGINIIKTFCRDATSDDNLDGVIADKILCDVPCSGLGILRRKPEIRYKDTEQINGLPEIQYTILCKSAKLLKTGGTLVYSTCTLNPEENNNIVNKFLSENKNFEPLKIELPTGITKVLDEPSNMITLFPQSCDTDGFFISAFKKTDT